jgi:hypothetical protein
MDVQLRQRGSVPATLSPISEAKAPLLLKTILHRVEPRGCFAGIESNYMELRNIITNPKIIPAVLFFRREISD